MTKGLLSVSALRMCQENPKKMFAQSPRLRGLSFSPVYGYTIRGKWLTTDSRGKPRYYDPNFTAEEILDRDWWAGTFEDFYGTDMKDGGTND